MTVHLPEIGPLVAARTYLVAELADRGIELPVGVTPPDGDQPQPYVLLSGPGGSTRVFLEDCMIRVKVFDSDAVRLERHADLLHRLMLAASHTKIVTNSGSGWVTGAVPSMAPASLDDPDVPMFGMQFSVFWVFGLHRERRGAIEELRRERRNAAEPYLARTTYYQ